MSRENVEIVRRFTEYWNDRDWAALRALHDPNVVGKSAEDRMYFLDRSRALEAVGLSE